ncbi:MAG: holo-[acyl-carrier-protein] synthase [Phycisphaerales bacterium]|nr:holo-[acyl-carrier-protein] synthase [Phycisphaerales bacterium]
MSVVGHGIDLVEVSRIEQMLKDHGERFLGRVFTHHEREYAASGGRQQGERLAARFAAKEAVLKAIGCGMRDGINWTDIEVRSLPSGQPTIVLSGFAAARALERGIGAWHVSLTHAGGRAMASVIASSLPS